MALIKADIPAHRADARKVKAFLRSFGTLAKTDAIDARAFARYGEDRHERLRRWQEPDRDRDQLHALVMNRHDLVTARQAFTNRLKAPNAASVEKPITALMTCLEEQIQEIEAAIEALLRANNKLNQAANTIQAIPGVGPVTAANLIGLMPELGNLSRREAASLAGLAPHPRQSGRPTAIAEPEAGGQRSNALSSWQRSLPQGTIRS